MYQEIFRIPLPGFLRHLFNLGPNLPVYGYGLMLVVAFLVCVQVAKMMARRKGMDPEVFVNCALIALVMGVIGARLSHVLENWSEYSNPQRSFGANFLDAINIRSGGLTFYGGFILATPCCIFYAIKSKISVLKGMDIVAAVLMIGLGFGRIGCYLNGCCYGAPCNPQFGQAFTQFPYYSNAYIEQFNNGQVRPPEQLLTHVAGRGLVLKNWDEVRSEGLTDLANQQKALPVQPTQLYSSFTAFLLAAVLIAFWTLPHLDGRVFAMMMMLEGPSRFILELIRVEPAVLHHLGPFRVEMSLSMVLGLALFVAGGIFWAALGYFHRNYRGAEPRLAVA